ncbi:MAG: hypothetical protein QM754_15100 [Tepidisphaeraceae bacterium]
MPTLWIMPAVILVVLTGIYAMDRHFSGLRASRMRRLAERCGFRYSRVDRFGLAKRVKSDLPVAASEIAVRDLMYRQEGRCHIYAFTVVYSSGQSRGALVLHAREVCGSCALSDVRSGDPSLNIGEQYRRLLHESSPAA